MRIFDQSPGSKNRQYYVLFREEFLEVPDALFAAVIPNMRFQIEHILPQNYQANWGDLVKTLKKTESPMRYVNNWGNICLLDPDTNNAIKDASWSEKVEGKRGSDGSIVASTLCYRKA